MNRRIFIDTVFVKGAAFLSFGLLTSCGYETQKKKKPLRKAAADALRNDPRPEEVHPSDKPQRPAPDSVAEKIPKGPESPEVPEVQYVEFYPLYAMATYFDGTLGPVTAEITEQNMINEENETLEFWHGHGGSSHSFELTKENKVKILNGEKVEITTSAVAGHSHKLFIDPTDQKWRIKGMQMVEVPMIKDV